MQNGQWWWLLWRTRGVSRKLVCEKPPSSKVVPEADGSPCPLEGEVIPEIPSAHSREKGPAAVLEDEVPHWGDDSDGMFVGEYRINGPGHTDWLSGLRGSGGTGMGLRHPSPQYLRDVLLSSPRIWERRWRKNCWRLLERWQFLSSKLSWLGMERKRLSRGSSFSVCYKCGRPNSGMYKCGSSPIRAGIQS